MPSSRRVQCPPRRLEQCPPRRLEQCPPRRLQLSLPALAALATFGFATLFAPPDALGARRNGKARDAGVPAPEVAFESFVLPNGLTLIVHEDHDAPVAAVNVWYHVGSKNEKRGRTGFAHLFEHLMFQGSENHRAEFFAPFERVGATEQNGTTNSDRTNYFQTVPTNALDMALFLESDRMGHLLGVIDQELLDEQRGVVQNEKRQNENQPYGRSWEILAEASYPDEHPYSWTTIGSMEDLEAASLEDVKDWFRTYYGAANAIVVVAGDVEPAAVRDLVSKYFGDIPAGPPLARPQAWIAARSGSRRIVLEDRVPQARVTMSWNVAQWGTADSDRLNLVSDVLATGKASRLHRRLVHEEQIATDVSSYMWSREIGGTFVMQATARPGADLARVEAILAEELERFVADGPTVSELERAKTQYRASFIRGLERVGGFGGVSDMLATSQVFGGRPDAWKDSWDRTMSATPGELVDSARRWLSDGMLVLEVHPFAERTTTPGIADRSRLPEVGPAREPRFPEIRRATLENGLDIVVAERRSVPQVVVRLLVDAGHASDPKGLAGAASLAADMLDEGTSTRDSMQIAEELESLGAELTTTSSLDLTTVSLSTLSETLDPALAVFADVVLDPSFPEADFARLKSQRLALIQREESDPSSIGMRLLPGLLYGEGHAYSNPMSGTGTTESVQAIDREALTDLHGKWFRPNNATLLVVGDASLDEVRAKVESLFGRWQSGEVPEKRVVDVQRPERPTVYLIDRPGSIQSVILAGLVYPPKADPDDLSIETMNRILGGTFTSRLNMNLREDKHWSYGSRSQVQGARGPRPFFVTAPVQTDKTSESMVEVLAELQGMRGGRPVAPDELAKAQDFQTLTLPGRWETLDAVANAITDVVRYGLPDDYWTSYAAKVRALEVGDIARVATRLVDPQALTWVVVGDRAKVEAGLRDLGWADVRVLDATGRSVAPGLAARSAEPVGQ